VPELYRNLAREDALLDYGDPSPRLCYWRAPHAVVMGKNQNPWKECNVPFLREQQILLARRVSGGGTVYHDPGNLNLCWAMDRSAYKADAPSRFLIQVLARLGFAAEEGPGGSVWVEGKKVSGSAFAYRRDRVLHHSTLLVHADLRRLRAVLSPTRMSLTTHAVSSVPAPVGNLTDWNARCTLEDVVEAMVAEAGASQLEAGPLDLEAEAGRMNSWAWIWGQTPTFRIPGVVVEGTSGQMEIRKGHIVSWENKVKRRLDPPLPFTRDGVRKLEAVWDLPSGGLQTELESKGWWLPPDMTDLRPGEPFPPLA